MATTSGSEPQMIPANDSVETIVVWPDLIRIASEQLFEQGWAVIANAIPPDLLRALQLELQERDGANELYRAGIGRGSTHQVTGKVRGDRIAWLEPEWPAAAAYLALMAQLQAHLNEMGFLGLADFEAHYAIYDLGSFYRRHTDQHIEVSVLGAGRRIVSTVLYLNDVPWPSDGGGELVLYPPEQATVNICPEGGSLVVFWSDTIVHEVLPAQQARRSIAGWMRTRGSELPV
ncbi:MAG: 2OG-Fe(II) oxygenase [Paraperlucidibaca sp.]|uniref:2OG-Fe(II) oxygenase n=1 Tax=Paraperlucidibaca sp. TaxID=2708021 RepID=UPI001B564379|nr:2OG-Fe(II) oxygenase [Paraperlucidibaca sp.]|tara:strand:+ start:544 stop:1239 length:696 start_codon:yes stop_codon:yes gene_type:complete